MKCRACGTEIAEKALICFRCGTSVEEAVTTPVPLKKTKRSVVVYVVFLILVLLAIAMMFPRHLLR